MTQDNNRLTDAVVQRLLAGLAAYELPDEQSAPTETIIAGVDTESSDGRPTPHLWQTSNQLYWCEDSSEFAAIGMGDWHAKSQLALARYHSALPLHEALWRAYTAKRSAERAI